MSISIKTVFLISLPLICLPAFTIGEGHLRSEPLPQKEPPKLHKLEYTGPEEGWPPRPKGQTNIKEVVSQEIPGSLTDALEERIYRAALQNARVRQLLGSRFAYIGMDEIEPDKERPRRPSDPLPTRVTFFSHAKNTAVEVEMKGFAVERAVDRKGYQPPEGADEVRQALALARQDMRLRGSLRGLAELNGIQVEVPQGTPGYGHRVIEVFFGTEKQNLPDYHALVDLTTKTVLVAEALRRR